MLSHSVDNVTFQYALKEWAPACAALQAGEQLVLFRRGGIREPRFRIQSKDFLLFPTAFHTEEHLLKPEAAVKYAKDIAYDPKQHKALSLGLAAEVTDCLVDPGLPHRLPS
ncbi:hypothetical protein WJX74_005155 [Apatococcus lobatus]|uniref:Uncharacterized protein n=1 Tax=Apatococcus lobatus TaxID=904363 RepID=A0AAW1SAW2_9CHLO